MKFTKISLVCLGALALFGCNLGNNNTTATDSQNISAISSGTPSFNIVGLATNCRTTPGSCSVSLQYTGSGGTIGYQIGSNQYVPSPNCPTITSSPQSCTFTINGSAYTSANQVTILVNTNPTTGIFKIGGGIPN